VLLIDDDLVSREVTATVLTMNGYTLTQREIPLDEALPWDHLNCGVTREFLSREHGLALAARSVPDCHWGPCYNCGATAATGFDCDTGKQGPRQLLVRQETNGNLGGTSPQWRYVGPPGDPRRVEGAPSGCHWPYDLIGVDMESKSAGLRGLASLVEAAGGESMG